MQIPENGKLHAFYNTRNERKLWCFTDFFKISVKKWKVLVKNIFCDISPKKYMYNLHKDHVVFEKSVLYCFHTNRYICHDRDIRE